jgi:hypothetical protein
MVRPAPSRAVRSTDEGPLVAKRLNQKEGCYDVRALGLCDPTSVMTMGNQAGGLLLRCGTAPTRIAAETEVKRVIGGGSVTRGN